MGCANRHVEESTLEKAFVMAWNGILVNKEYFWKKWERQKLSKNLLEMYRAKDFQELIIKDATQIMTANTDFLIRVLDYIKITENGAIQVVF